MSLKYEPASEQLAFGVCAWSRQDEVYPLLKEKPFNFNAALDPAVASVALNLLSVRARAREGGRDSV